MPTIHKGVVTSIGKMIKTCTVTVTYYREVPKILKAVKRSSKFLVHDEHHVSRLGDRVSITDGISYSGRKHFRLAQIDRKGKDPERYSKRAPEWITLENRTRAAEQRALDSKESLERKYRQKEKSMEVYAQRLRETGVASGSKSGARQDSA